MKKLAVLFIILLKSSIGYSQTDKNGNPVFESVIVSEEKFEDIELTSSYYTLKNNIENKGSSVFISEKPTLNQIENAATSLASNFYILTKNRNILYFILITGKPRTFLVVNPNTGSKNEYPCKIKGSISENRAMEMINNNYDSKASLNGNKLLFNNNNHQVFSNAEAKDAILQLIKAHKLNNVQGSAVVMRSQNELKALVLQETKEGGKLDFFTPIKGHEYDGMQIKPGIISTMIGIALYKWGRANFDLGISTLDDAVAVFSEFKGRELNQREKDYIKMGFTKELEK
ncbi:hypothetical protein [Hymenobacter negativus]|uniref:Spi protease inhibitor domain-containing protein n=1 Tax=Hymenobacter negativus TaxID=2795026 RepID=A0ABS3Q8S8_9BACT|nr:hypothetical protein [Hymenobacter negativus]MBO2007648.1 hypothetical protein [Hymenobacter negativus]